ncbi:helix-turn-helix domain-containing protein [Sphingobacterium sp. 2149]|uniref:helix-turn-helix domain-containing protein n=1 Tax=Sphingobacterium sp. 2149 TaxID=2817763 RepID=UPI00285AA7B3|nr:helix-turn-helix domain-containing protein [Sphingobacterium sp. 2149]MDR6734800.1 AraC-like DNA-binding protein [Sphingobacterium sp. 2149]
MKKALHLHLESVFGASCPLAESTIQPQIALFNGKISHYRHPSGQACLQEFDGLLGYINLLDVAVSSDIVIPVRVKRSDMHIIYVFSDESAVQIKDVGQQTSYSITCNRGRYFYLNRGDYEIYIPAGSCTLVNFYFRGSIFRDGNERPFQFLHHLIDAYRNRDRQSCCSIDFRVGPRTVSLMKSIAAKIKKSDLDSEVNILWAIKKLIQLSKEKIFEEYEKISQSQAQSKAAYSAIKQAVAAHGQDFKLEDIAYRFGISKDYLHQLIHSYYGKSPQELKIAFMVRLAKKYIADGMRTDEIAYELGYTSPSSFVRFFKNQTGMTPTAYFKRNNQ